MLTRCVPFAAAAKPVRETVSQAETTRGKTFLVGRTDRAALLYVGCVHVRGEGRYQRVEYIGGEGDERRQRGICVGERDVKAEDGGSIWPWACPTVSSLDRSTTRSHTYPSARR